MNKIFKVIYSKVRNCYVVTSEFAKANTKSSTGSEKSKTGKKALLTLAVASAIMCGGWMNVGAADTVHVDESINTTYQEVYTKDGADKTFATKDALATKADATTVTVNTTNIETNKNSIQSLQNDKLDKTTAEETYAKKTDVATNTANIANNTTEIAKKIDKDLADATYAKSSDVYTTTQVDQKVTEALTTAGTSVDTKLADYAKTADVNTKLRAKADKSTTLAGYGITDAYTKKQTNDKLAQKADASDVYTKGDIDTKMGNVYIKTEVDGKLADEVNARDTAITEAIQGEAEDRTNAINTAINGEVANRNAAIADAKTELQEKITAEETARKEADNKLEEKIAANTTAINNEATARANADDALDKRIGKVDTDGTYIKASSDANTIAKNLEYLDKGIGTKTDGEYVRNTKTVNENLKALDDQVKTNTENIAKNADDIAKLDKSSVKYDNDVKDKITLGGVGGTTITNLKDAALNDSSTDAVTGKQLNKTNEDLKTEAKTREDADKALSERTTKLEENTGGIKRNTEDTKTTIEGKVTVDNEGNISNVKDLNTKTITTTGKAEIGGKLTVKGDLVTEKSITNKKDENNYTKIDGGHVTSKNLEVNEAGQSVSSSSTFNAEENKIGFANNATGNQSFHKQDESGFMDNVKDNDNSNNRTQTKTETKDTITDKDGNSSTTSQTASENKTYLEDKGKKNTNTTVDTAKNYNKTIQGENGKTSTSQDELNITNTAQDGTITNDAKDIVNSASGNISNSATNITNSASEKLTDKVGENTRVIDQTSISDTVGNTNRKMENGKIDDTIQDASGNGSDFRQRIDAIMGNVKSADGESEVIQNGNQITSEVGKGESTNSKVTQTKDKIKSVLTDGTNTTEKLQTATDITNTAKNGTIKNDAKDIINNATGNMTNTVGGDLTTTVTGKTVEDYKGGLTTTVTGDESHTVTGNQTNTIKGNQTTTVTGDISNSAANITNEATGTLTDKVGKNTRVLDKDGITDTVGNTFFKQRVDDILMEAKNGTITNDAKNLVNKAAETITNEAVDITNNATGTISSNASEIKNKAGKLISNKVGENTYQNIEDGKITESIKNGTKQNLTQSDADGTNHSVVNGNKSSVTKQTSEEITGAVTDGTSTNVTQNTATSSNNTIASNGKANSVISTVNGTEFVNSDAAAPVTGASGAGTADRTTIKGNTITTGKVTMDYADVMKDLGVRGNANIAGKTTTGELEVTGKSTLKGDVTMESNATVKKDLTVDGNATVKKDFTVDGTTTTKDLSVTNNATIGGTLDVTGKATFKDSVDVAKDLNVGGNATITGDVTANSYKVGGKTYIDANGINANNQVISNVADGTIAEGSMDAVNGGQLFETNRRIDQFDSRINEVGANAAAMANLHPMEFDADSKLNVAVGVGNYRNKTATAMGLFYRPNEDVMFNVSSTIGSSDNMIGGGVSFRLGSGGNKLKNKAFADAAEQNKQLKSQVDTLQAQMDALLSVINPNMSKDFPDVPDNHWAYEAVSRLAGNDIIQGYEDGKYHGERTMTRYEMAVIIYKALQKGAKAEAKLVEEFKPELKAIAAHEKA